MADDFLTALQEEADRRKSQDTPDPFLAALEGEKGLRQNEVNTTQDLEEVESFYAEQRDAGFNPVEEDFLAAGFTESQVNAFNEKIATEQGRVSPAVIAASSDESLYPMAPSADMYDGYRMGRPSDTVDDEGEITAYALYNSFKDSPYTEQNAIGEYIYNDPATGKRRRLLPPEERRLKAATEGTFLSIEDMPAGTSLETLAREGLRDSFTEVAELGAAIGDITVEKVFDVDPGLTEWVQENTATTSTGMSETDAFLKEGLALTVGFFGGGALAKGVTKIGGRAITSLADKTALRPALEASSKLSNKIIQFDPQKLAFEIGGAAGTAAVLDSETETLLFGENGLLGTDALEILGVKVTDDAAQQVLAARTNLLADALIGAGIVEGGLRTGGKLLKFMNDVSLSQIITRVSGGMDGAKQRAVKNVLDELSSIEASSTGEDFLVARERLVKLIQENSEIILKDDTSSVNSEVILDVFSSLEAEGAVTPRTLTKLRGMRTGAATAGGGDALVDAMDRPARAVEDVLTTKADESFSAGNNPERVADTVVAQQAVREQNALNQVVTLEAAIRDNDVQAIRNVLGNERFGPIVERVMNTSPSQITAMADDVLVRLAQGAVDEVTALNATKNGLFEAIPSGVEFDYAGFADAVASATRDANAFDDTGRSLLSTRLISTIKQGFEEAGGIDIKDLDSLSVDDLADLSGMMQAAGVDLKVLYNSIRPRVSDLAEEAFTKGHGEVGRKLASIRSAIDEQVEWVAENADPEAAQAAQAAMDFYKTDFAPLVRQGKNKELDQSMQRNRLDPLDLQDETKATVQSTLTEGTRNNVNQLLDLLGGDASAVSNVDVEEYITANIFEKLYQTVRQGGLEGLDDAQVSSLIQQYGTQLRALGDDSMLASQLDDFTQRILAARGSKGQLEAALEEAQTTLDGIKDDAFARLIQPFLNKNSDDLMATANPEAQLLAFVRGTNGPDQVRTLLAETGDNPIIREGLQNAYFKELRNSLMGATETVSGARVFKPTEVRRLLQDEGKLTAVGQELFKGDESTARLVDSVIQLADRGAAGRGARIIPGMSGTAEVQAYQGAVNRLIYATVGPLNRTGTQLRAIANLAADKADITGVFDQAMSLVTADATEFARIAEQVLRKERTVGLAGIRVDREVADDMFRLAVRAGLYTQADEDRDEFYTNWEKAMEGEKFARDALESTRNTMYDSMFNLFGKPE